jgi:hypothetical protein
VSGKQVIANIKSIYTRRLAQLEALNRYYAALAINYFISVQKTGIGNPGKWWHNQTEQAAARMFTNAFKDGTDIGWYIAHGVDYGVWLTLANDRRHDALTPIIKRYAGRYFNDAKKLFGG